MDNVVISQLQREIMLSIKGLCMKESYTLADNVDISQSTSKRNLTQHKRVVHEGVGYPYGQCGHQSTSKGHLAEHKRAVHEGVKYPFGQCGHQSTSKGHLAEHERGVHEGVKYLCGQCGNR